MKIDLTKEQYRNLVELLFLGDWLVNATRTGAEGDKRIQKYEELQQKIYSYANDFQSNDIIMKEYGEYYTTRLLEEPLMGFVEEYDNYTFFEQLSIQLAERDWRRALGPIRKITEEHLDRKRELEEIYEEEIQKNGLKNIVVKNLKV